MIKKTSLIALLFISFTITIILSSCSTHSANRKPDNPLPREDNRSIKPTGSNRIQPQSDAREQKDKSGRISQVPWVKQNTFQQAQRDNNTMVLLAAYRTVLRDPLPGEEYNVHLAARLLAGTVVQPGQVFSQNQTIGPYASWKGFQEGPVYIGSQVSTTTGGGVCKMASTLYNVAVLSDLPIIERHAHSMPVPYVPYGQDATVSYGCKDLRFQNNTDAPLLIWSQGVDNILYVGFYGRQKAPEVEWHHKTIRRLPVFKIVRYNDSLPAGTEKTLMSGMDGAQISSWVTVTNQGHTNIKRMGISYYSPMPSIVERNGNPVAGNTQ